MARADRSRADAETTVAAWVLRRDPATLAPVRDPVLRSLADLLDVVTEARPDDPNVGAATTEMVRAILDSAHAY